MGSDDLDYEWEKEVEEFEKSKAGVKGLVDSGITKVPGFFVAAPCGGLPHLSPTSANDIKEEEEKEVQIPVIDLMGAEIGGDRRMQVINEIREASESWGFFQMVNHGVPMSTMNAILESTRRFHEQPKEAKMDLYSSDGRRNVRFYTINGRLKKSDVASWRDAFSCTFMDGIVDPDLIPPVCREEITDYMKHMNDLRKLLSELLSEALGLSHDSLDQLECMDSQYLSCLYYPACPEPHKTFGTGKHSDPTILTILLQDTSGGLQIHNINININNNNSNWVDVPPIPGALIANIGDLLQLITNDKFKSVEHRVLSRASGTRLSAACFFYPSANQMPKPYGPMKELVSEDNQPLYREVNYIEFVTHYQKHVREGHSNLSNFKLIPEGRLAN